MLIIRNEQIACFRQASVARFVAHMVSYIAREYPAHYAALGSAPTRALVDRSIEAAQQLRIEAEGEVGVLTELRLLYGDGLERAPDCDWAHSMLAHPSLPASIRVGAVRDRCLEMRDGQLRFVAQTPVPSACVSST